MSVGVDVGTNRLVAASIGPNGEPIIKTERDAFFRIEPKSDVNSRAIKMSLEKSGSSYVLDSKGNFNVVGEDALQIALDRNQASSRPMQKGVISPEDKDNMPMLKLLLESLIGRDSSKLVYSVPASPVEEDFDIEYHTTLLNMFFSDLGYEATPINEAFAVGLNELIDTGLTGITLSCLVPGTKIYTNRGIINIEDINISDLVITHKGRYKPVTNIVKKQFKGLCTKIQMHGYSDTTEMYKFVDNHELYVYKNAAWSWIGCEEVQVGDIIGEPIINQDLNKNSHTLTICERITCSDNYSKKSILATPDVYRLLGYFLGDGSISERDSGIQFDFNKHELDNINDIIDILDKNFSKNCSTYEKEGCIRVKCYSVGLASWFKNNCYDLNGYKIFPWDLSRMKKSDCLSLLAGLVKSDGTISENTISFFNTSTNLIVLCKQLFSRLGIASTIYFREPRSHTLSSGRVVKGTKQEWVVSSGKKELHSSLADIITNINCSNSRYTERTFILDNFCCTRIQAIEFENYEGVVYDIQVEDDHSFSGPYLTIHNCGAGMTNIALIAQGDPIITFATLRSGDYIDKQVGKALAMSASLVQLEKEAGVDLFNPSNKIMEAIAIYYKSVIKYTVDNIAYEIKKRRSTIPVFREAVPIVLSGGLAWAKGYKEVFESELLTRDFPFEIGEVKVVSNPNTCVALGCLLASQL